MFLKRFVPRLKLFLRVSAIDGFVFTEKSSNIFVLLASSNIFTWMFEVTVFELTIQRLLY